MYIYHVNSISLFTLYKFIGEIKVQYLSFLLFGVFSLKLGTFPQYQGVDISVHFINDVLLSKLIEFSAGRMFSLISFSQHVKHFLFDRNCLMTTMVWSRFECTAEITKALVELCIACFPFGFFIFTVSSWIRTSPFLCCSHD